MKRWVSFPSAPVGRRILKFFDETEVGLIGLDEIMAELYSEGRKATDETAEAIIKSWRQETTISLRLNVSVKSTPMPC